MSKNTSNPKSLISQSGSAPPSDQSSSNDQTIASKAIEAQTPTKIKSIIKKDGKKTAVKKVRFTLPEKSTHIQTSATIPTAAKRPAAPPPPPPVMKDRVPTPSKKTGPSRTTSSSTSRPVAAPPLPPLMKDEAPPLPKKTGPSRTTSSSTSQPVAPPPPLPPRTINSATTPVAPPLPPRITTTNTTTPAAAAGKGLVVNNQRVDWPYQSPSPKGHKSYNQWLSSMNFIDAGSAAQRQQHEHDSGSGRSQGGLIAWAVHKIAKIFGLASNSTFTKVTDNSQSSGSSSPKSHDIDKILSDGVAKKHAKKTSETKSHVDKLTSRSEINHTHDK